ncbi:nuclear transport factor 2 family protein [Roseateles chitinivorans]|uniref:nuclear transport factor 2 family protein n=1 Tax=Roseateles chitinivorans TaxID=2917965 RepID=UPI003D668FC9
MHPSIPDAELLALIAQLDPRHFDAFNSCDTQTLQALYAPDVEFFHDLNGHILNREQFIQGVRKNICGKVQRRVRSPVTRDTDYSQAPRYSSGRRWIRAGTVISSSRRLVLLGRRGGASPLRSPHTRSVTRIASPRR